MSVDSQPAGDHRSEGSAVAEKSVPVAVILGIFLSPAAYLYVGKTKWAIINLVTLNYLMLGLVATPVHVYKIIDNAGAGGR
jgi:hypothetical protein